MRTAKTIAALAAAMLLGLPLGASTQPVQDTPVVLLHGLARSPASMNTIARQLAREGYQVCNVGYPSREHSLEVLAREHVAPAVIACAGGADQPVHFVTHSMGGLVVRELAASGSLSKIERVVMLAPPNQGSELIEAFRGLPAFQAVSGPASAQLSTAQRASPQSVRGLALEVGVIAGTRSVNPLLSLRIPGPDDGKVAVARTQLDGARDSIALPVSHPFILVDGETLAQTLHFLREGRFRHATH